MKVCFSGLGSIGKRHLKNVVKIFKEYNLQLEVHAFRQTSKLLETDIKRYIDFEIYDEKNLATDYDITFITNPTHLHYETIKLMENRTKHMFIEKPVFDDKKYDINQLNLDEEGIYYIAGPLKFTSVFQNLKQILKREKIYSIRAICSSYLPNWRTGVDYRKIYSAKKNEGGGVSIDLIHEWDYITDLFGFPVEVFNLNGHYSHLEIDSEDISIYIARYQDKLVEIHLDYFGRVPRREIEILTKEGTIIGDFIQNKITFTDGRTSLDFSKENRDIYIEEMKTFINNVLTTSKGQNDVEHATKVLRLAVGSVQ